MASKQTSNYQLNLWEPGDSFLREEFNENSVKVDGALAVHDGALADRLRMVTGSYTGNGAQSHTIDLGVTAQVVFIVPDSGTSGEYPTAVVKGQTAGNVSQYPTNSAYTYTFAWSGTTLRIASASKAALNQSSVRYRWAALY